MANFIMIVGPAGSGKSTFAQYYADKHYSDNRRGDIVIISSDALRAELYGNAEDQTNPKRVFEEMNKRTLQALRRDVSVIYDATNLTKKYRMNILDEVRAIEVNGMPIITACYMIDVPLDQALYQNAHRDRVVPEYVIKRHYAILEKPTRDEGWDLVYAVKTYSKPIYILSKVK